MITNIISDTISTTTDATLSTFEPEININSKIVFDVNGSLTLPIIGDVEDTIQGKQDTIEDGDLTIAKTSGLQTALDNKYDDTCGTIDGDVDITGNQLVNDVNIIDEIGTKQDTIEDGDLTIAKTSGLQTALDNKQDEITSSTDLSCNSISTKQLPVSEDVFNTIVIRRPTDVAGSPSSSIFVRELQCWVNDINILATNSGSLNTYFANFTDNSVEIASSTHPATRIHDNIIISSGFEIAGGSGLDGCLIIKNIPDTAVKEIQSLVFYVRNDFFQGRVFGLAIELNNADTDPNLTQVLASTSVISTYDDVYRNDFPAIDTYTGGFF